MQGFAPYKKRNRGQHSALNLLECLEIGLNKQCLYITVIATQYAVGPPFLILKSSHKGTGCQCLCKTWGCCAKSRRGWGCASEFSCSPCRNVQTHQSAQLESDGRGQREQENRSNR